MHVWMLVPKYLWTIYKVNISFFLTAPPQPLSRTGGQPTPSLKPEHSGWAQAKTKRNFTARTTCQSHDEVTLNQLVLDWKRCNPRLCKSCHSKRFIDVKASMKNMKTWSKHLCSLENVNSRLFYTQLYLQYVVSWFVFLLQREPRRREREREQF